MKQEKAYFSERIVVFIVHRLPRRCLKTSWHQIKLIRQSHIKYRRFLSTAFQYYPKEIMVLQNSNFTKLCIICIINLSGIVEDDDVDKFVCYCKLPAKIISKQSPQSHHLCRFAIQHCMLKMLASTRCGEREVHVFITSEYYQQTD